MPATFGNSAIQVGLGSPNSRLRRGNFGLRLRHACHRPIDFGLLQLFLASVVLDCSFCSLHRRTRLRYLRAVIVIVELN